MKRLYCILLKLSLSEQPDLSRREALWVELNKEISQFGFKKSFQDICVLADFLFEELERRFKQVFDDLCNISLGLSSELACKDSDLWDTFKDLMLLLRSCLVIWTLVAFEQNMLMEKGSILHSVLRKFIYLATSGKDVDDPGSFEKFFSHECRFIDSGSTTFVFEDFVASLCILGPSYPCYPFPCAVLEVFVDELLMHRSLREYFMLIDSASSATKMLFMQNSAHGCIGTVLELISVHLIRSVSGEQAFLNFLNRLCWAHYENLRVPELSLTAALSLLLNPVMLSAPKLLQTHFISLVSEVIGIGVFLKSPNPDHTLMDWYLLAFERAITLYNRHMSDFHMKGASLNSSASRMPYRNCQQPIESYITQVRREEIDNLMSKYENTCLLSRAKSDLLTLSISYVVENQHVLDESCKDDILSILHYIILRASLDDVNDDEIYDKGHMSHHDIYILASILKLMSSSMLPVLWCLRHCGSSGSLKILRDVSSCKEYGFILGIISCFKEFGVRLPTQKFIHGVMKTHPKRHEDSKWMFLHFTGLLALSFSKGLDFLVKDCILVIMTILNLFVFEEGHLDALLSLAESEKAEEDLLNPKSSEAIAIQFQKIQTLHLSTDSLTSIHETMQDDDSIEHLSPMQYSQKECTIDVEEMEKTSSGEIFLKCLLTDMTASSSYDDIADFIECKPGKDYLHWMKNRQRYRKWKSQKLAFVRWKEKTKAWKFVKGKKK